MNYYSWNIVGIISENEEDWERRGDFLESFLKSQGKTVSMHGKIQYLLLYKQETDGDNYMNVLKQMMNKARSK